MKKIFALYRPRYLRTLAYMLQASEYNPRDYVEWLQRTRDFSQVARRKDLVLTSKARLVLLILWLMAGLYWLGVLALAFAGGSLTWAAAAFLVIIAPYALAYAVLVPVLLLRYLVQVPLERRIISQASERIRRHKGVKIGIAGSYGKTTFKEILLAVLGEAKSVAATPGNYNTPIGISRFAKTLRGREQVLIFELGEYYPGDIKRLCEMVRPQIGVITGVNEAHLSKFKTLENAARTIFELADYLDDKPVYVNGSNPLTRSFAAPDHIIFDAEGAGDWKVSEAETSLDGTSFKLTRGKEKLKLRSPLLGMHQVGPLAAAAVIAHQLGLTAKQIEQGVANTSPFDHRLQLISRDHGVVTIDDTYNGNPDGAKAAIDFLRQKHGHRRIYVTPGLVEMGRRAQQVHESIGAQLADACEVVVLVRNSVTPFIEEGLKEAGFGGEVLWYPDAQSCFAALKNITKAGDLVLMQNDWPDNYA